MTHRRRYDLTFGYTVELSIDLTTGGPKSLECEWSPRIPCARALPGKGARERLRSRYCEARAKFMKDVAQITGGAVAVFDLEPDDSLSGGDRFCSGGYPLTPRRHRIERTARHGSASWPASPAIVKKYKLSTGDERATPGPGGGILKLKMISRISAHGRIFGLPRNNCRSAQGQHAGHHAADWGSSNGCHCVGKHVCQ